MKRKEKRDTHRKKPRCGLFPELKSSVEKSREDIDRRKFKKIKKKKSTVEILCIACVCVCCCCGDDFLLCFLLLLVFWKRPAGGGKDITRDQWNASHKRASGIFHQQCMKPSLLCTPDRPFNISQQLPYFLLACIFNWFYWLVWICTNKRRGGVETSRDSLLWLRDDEGD